MTGEIAGLTALSFVCKLVAGIGMCVFPFAMLDAIRLRPADQELQDRVLGWFNVKPMSAEQRARSMARARRIMAASAIAVIGGMWIGIASMYRVDDLRDRARQAQVAGER